MSNSFFESSIKLQNFDLEKDESSSDAEAKAEAEAPKVVAFWWKFKHLKICRFCFQSISLLLFKY
jgi:hypothetical protein